MTFGDMEVMYQIENSLQSSFSTVETSTGDTENYNRYSYKNSSAFQNESSNDIRHYRIIDMKAILDLEDGSDLTEISPILTFIHSMSQSNALWDEENRSNCFRNLSLKQLQVDARKSNEDEFTFAVSLRDGSCLYTSDAVTTHLGYTSDMLKGQCILNYLFHKDHITFANHLTQGLNACFTQGKRDDSHLVINIFFCRLRLYQSLNGGYSFSDPEFEYRPYKITLHINELIVDDLCVEKPLGTLCVKATATKVSSAYTEPEEIPAMISFSTRHTPSCHFSHVDTSAIPYLGYLPQDMIGYSVFDFYHIDDMPQLKDIYHLVVEEHGSSIRSKPYRFKVQNGCYIVLETEWSCFINPWSHKLEFVVGQHRVLQGPLDINIFNPSQKLEETIISDEIMKAGKRIQKEIRGLLCQSIETVELNQNKKVCNKRKRDLAEFVNNCIDEGCKAPKKRENDESLGFLADRSSSESEDSVVMGDISPYRENSDSMESSESPQTVQQYQLQDNMERFFASEPKTYSEESGECIPQLPPIEKLSDDFPGSSNTSGNGSSNGSGNGSCNGFGNRLSNGSGNGSSNGSGSGSSNGSGEGSSNGTGEASTSKETPKEQDSAQSKSAPNFDNQKSESNASKGNSTSTGDSGYGKTMQQSSNDCFTNTAGSSNSAWQTGKTMQKSSNDCFTKTAGSSNSAWQTGNYMNKFSTCQALTKESLSIHNRMNNKQCKQEQSKRKGKNTATTKDSNNWPKHIQNVTSMTQTEDVTINQVIVEQNCAPGQKGTEIKFKNNPIHGPTVLTPFMFPNESGGPSPTPFYIPVMYMAGMSYFPPTLNAAPNLFFDPASVPPSFKIKQNQQQPSASTMQLPQNRSQFKQNIFSAYIQAETQAQNAQSTKMQLSSSSMGIPPWLPPFQEKTDILTRTENLSCNVAEANVVGETKSYFNDFNMQVDESTFTRNSSSIKSSDNYEDMDSESSSSSIHPCQMKFDPNRAYRYQLNLTNINDVLKRDMEILKKMHQPDLVNEQLRMMQEETEIERKLNCSTLGDVREDFYLGLATEDDVNEELEYHEERLLQLMCDSS